MPTIKLLPKKTNKKKPYVYRGPKNDARRKERQKVYQSKLYKILREEKRRSNPLCQVCELYGRVKLMEHVHHLVSFVGIEDPDRAKELAYDFSNLLSVCRAHHTALHEGYLKGCRSLEEIAVRIKTIKEEDKNEL